MQSDKIAHRNTEDSVPVLSMSYSDETHLKNIKWCMYHTLVMFLKHMVGKLRMSIMMSKGLSPKMATQMLIVNMRIPAVVQIHCCFALFIETANQIPSWIHHGLDNPWVKTG